MKNSEILKKTPDELAKLELQLTVDLLKYQGQAATGAPGKDSGKIREIKKTLARIKARRGGTQ